MKINKTFTATIYIGFREGYSDAVHTYSELKDICQDFCNKNPLCVSISPVNYIYVNGEEDGASVTLINYPRFPSNPKDITQKAIDLAKVLKKRFNQNRVSIVTSDKTYMLE